MPQLLVSGKTGSNKYELRSTDPNKVLPRLDVRQIAENSQALYEVTQGYSLSGNEGSAEAYSSQMSLITTSNLNSTYKDDDVKALQTLISHRNYLDVDSGTTANAIILKKTKISTQTAPDGNNYTREAALPFIWEDNLTFSFRATLTNTGATTINITDFAGMSGAVSCVDEDGNALAGGEIVQNRYYEIITKTISSTKKFILKKGGLGTAAYKNTGTSSGNVPLIGTQSATTSLAGLAPLATSTEVRTGTDSGKIITPNALAGAMVNSKTTSGYTYLANGLIFQWGTGSAQSGSDVASDAQTVVFPITFPNAVFSVVCGQLASDNRDAIYQVYGITTSQFRAFANAMNTGGSGTITPRWIAIGY